jgi:hypothetical protein
VTLADDLKPVVFVGRGLAGEYGFRPHTVEVVVSYWSGQHTGEGHDGDEVTAITEGNGYPPKVRVMNAEEIALGNLPNDTLEIGPITPEFSGGGTPDSLLFGKLPQGATRYIRVTGPIAPNGAMYRIKASRRDRSLRRILHVEPVIESQ